MYLYFLKNICKHYKQIKIQMHLYEIVLVNVSSRSSGIGLRVYNVEPDLGTAKSGAPINGNSPPQKIGCVVGTSVTT